MMPVTIRCCYLSPDAVIPPNVFFILSKGDNAGKPGLKPWVNSFVVISNNPEMKEFYFWLTYGLYKAKSFKTIHRGSVIQYVNLRELRHVIMKAADAIYPTWQEFKKILQQMEQLEAHKNNLVKLLKTTGTLQEYLIRNFLQQHGVKD